VCVFFIKYINHIGLYNPFQVEHLGQSHLWLKFLLIGEFCARRLFMCGEDEMPEENILDTRPKNDVEAVFRPVWWTEIVSGKNGSLVQLLHPDHGWLTFVLPPECAVNIALDLPNNAV